MPGSTSCCHSRRPSAAETRCSELPGPSSEKVEISLDVNLTDLGQSALAEFGCRSDRGCCQHHPARPQYPVDLLRCRRYADHQQIDQVLAVGQPSARFPMSHGHPAIQAFRMQTLPRLVDQGRIRVQDVHQKPPGIRQPGGQRGIGSPNWTHNPPGIPIATTASSIRPRGCCAVAAGDTGARIITVAQAAVQAIALALVQNLDRATDMASPFSPRKSPLWSATASACTTRERGTAASRPMAARIRFPPA